MKKIIGILLATVITFSFAACSKENNESEIKPLDLEYFANLGKIPECDYALGESVEKVNDELSKSAEAIASQGGDVVYNVLEGDKTVCMDNGTDVYYYTKEKAENGIAFIVCLDKAYGFPLGTVSIEIKEAFKNLEYTEEPADDNNSFFVFGLNNASVLRYSIGKNTVLFVFEDNALCATAIYNTDDWI